MICCFIRWGGFVNIGNFILPKLMIISDINHKGENPKSFEMKDRVFLDNHIDLITTDHQNRIVSASDYAIMNGAPTHSSETLKNITQYILGGIADLDQVSMKVVKNNGYFTYNDVAVDSNCICPAMQLDINAFMFSQKLSPDYFQINFCPNVSEKAYHTLALGGYPNNFVDNDLKNKLNFLKNSGKLQPTGKFYMGYYDSKSCEFIKNPEYQLDNRKFVYTRTKVFDNCNYSDETSLLNNNDFMWAEVKPLIWKIRNWEQLPQGINPTGTGVAKFIDIRTENAIHCGMPFFAGRLDSNCNMWQNSTLRAFLNGYDIHNELSMKNGNYKYKTYKNFDFTEHNFLNDAFDLTTEQIDEMKNNKNCDFLKNKRPMAKTILNELLLHDYENMQTASNDELLDMLDDLSTRSGMEY